MRRVTISVIGNGKTTRANVEALLGDFLDSVDEASFALVYNESMSDGQIWTKQFVENTELTIVEYPNNDYDALFSDEDKDELKFFVFWDDEDPECQRAASWAQENGVSVYDLCQGLMQVPLKRAVIEKPAQVDMPAAEMITVPKPEEVEEPEDELSDEDLLLEEAVTALVELLLVRVSDEVVRRLKGE